MKIYRYTRQEFEATLVKGHDWSDRCEKVGNAVEEILEQSPVGKVYRAGALTSAILKAYDIPRDRANPFHKIVSAVITQLGKQPGHRHHISTGKEIRCGVKPDGSPRWARERLWKGAAVLVDDIDADLSHLAPAEIRGASIDKVWIDELAPAEDKFSAVRRLDADPEHKSVNLNEEVALACLESLGYTIVPPARLSKHCHVKIEYSDNSKPSWELDTVQGVDNPNISKHPSPGAARVDCGECGGTGKVYIKQGA